MLNINEIRSQFPILSKKKSEKQYVYFDNAATTHKPTQVINSINNFYTNYNSNIQRGVYSLANKATNKYEESRGLISKLLNTRHKEEIIFTSGVTHSINMVAFGYLNNLLLPGDEILIGEMEHHANIVPWQAIASKMKFKINVVNCCKDGKIKIDDLRKKLNSRVKLLAIQHVSNITGHENNIKEICSIAHAENIKVFVDGAQAVSHKKIDVQDLDCDFYCFSGHKCYGPTGVGVLYGKKSCLLKMDPFMYGGNMINKVSFENSSWGEIPHKFEAGTANIAGVIGLGESIKYISSVGLKNIQEREALLINKMWHHLKSIDEIIVYTNTMPTSPIFSFNLKNIHSYDAGSLLDEMNICVRTGHLCAQTAINSLGVSGLIRASLSFYNTEQEVELFFSAIKKVLKFL